MWITDEDELMMQRALSGSVEAIGHESRGYIKGEYCPRCGAQRVKMDFTGSYIYNGYRRSEKLPLIRQLLCNHCLHGYADTLAARWALRTRFTGNSLEALPPVAELCNPHNWRKNRELVRQLTREANGKKCRARATGDRPNGYYGRCRLPFGHSGAHRHVSEALQPDTT